MTTIALASPDRILALLDTNERQAARIAELEAALRDLVNAWDWGVNPDPAEWERLDADIDRALAAARAALAPGTGEGE